MEAKNMELLTQAANEGIAWARSLKMGDLFIGAMPEAEKHGYAKDTSAYRVFVATAADFMPAAITVDRAGRIIKLG